MKRVVAAVPQQLPDRVEATPPYRLAVEVASLVPSSDCASSHLSFMPEWAKSVRWAAAALGHKETSSEIVIGVRF